MENKNNNPEIHEKSTKELINDLSSNIDNTFESRDLEFGYGSDREDGSPVIFRAIDSHPESADTMNHSHLVQTISPDGDKMYKFSRYDSSNNERTDFTWKDGDSEILGFTHKNENTKGVR